MNRRAVNNTVVSLAGVLAASNAEADAEIEELQEANKQLRAVCAARYRVVEAARAYANEVERVAEPDGNEGTKGKVDIALFNALVAALKGCP